MAPGTMRLVSHDYSLAAGQEIYLCKHFTISSDVLIGSITPLNGPATHHEVLGIDTKKSQPDGVAECGDQAAEFDMLNWSMLFASGAGSPALHIPKGAALRLHAGDQIIFQMHLLNALNTPTQGTAALDIVPVDPATMPIDAQMILAGPLPDPSATPAIPVGTGQLVKGKCTLPAATNYFAVFPHMHQIGRHIQVTVTQGGASKSIYDSDYTFSNQVFAEFSPLPLAKGDQIGVTCTYDNMTGTPVPFGLSSLQEMCFAISYLYPPVPTAHFGDFCAQ
jgi:hypothetical protein